MIVLIDSIIQREMGDGRTGERKVVDFIHGGVGAWVLIYYRILGN